MSDRERWVEADEAGVIAMTVNRDVGIVTLTIRAGGIGARAMLSEEKAVELLKEFLAELQKDERPSRET